VSGFFMRQFALDYKTPAEVYFNGTFELTDFSKNQGILTGVPLYPAGEVYFQMAIKRRG